MQEYLWILTLVAGAAAAWLILHFRYRSQVDAKREEYEALRADRDAIASEKLRLEERLKLEESSLAKTRGELEEQRTTATSLERSLATANEQNRNLNERIGEQKAELESIHKKLTAEFENLANRILDEKSKKFVVQNKESLDKILLPLSERIGDFRERVEKSREEDIKDRAALKEQLRSLRELNQQMGKEAQNLATALKGQVKTQGNWGELILERVLEKSGLVAGQEYDTQVSLTDDAGKRFQPDVLIRLPEEKHLVVDSKVSLLAYERYANAPDKKVQEAALKEHVASVRTHIGDLSKKGYEKLYGIHSPDFVLMFIPVEPAFTAAMIADDALFDFAFRQNVVLVTPSTLLVTLRTVANIWRQEKQTRNALEIARKGGDLYDKFVGFYGDMEEIGRRINKSQEAYDGAMKKLRTGRGNLVRRVEELRKLGARATKDLPSDSLEELEN